MKKNNKFIVYIVAGIAILIGAIAFMIMNRPQVISVDHYAVGKNYFDQKEYSRAISEFSTAISSDQSKELATYYKGLVYDMKNLDALTFFKAASNDYPGSLDINSKYLEILNRDPLHNSSEKLQALSNLMKMDLTGEKYNTVARQYYQLKFNSSDIAQAKNELCSSIIGKNSDTELNMYCSLTSYLDPVAATKYVANASSQNQAVYADLTSFREIMDKFVQNSQGLDKDTLLSQIANIQIKYGLNTTAIEILNKLIEANDAYYLNFLQRGIAYYNLGNSAEAIKDFERSKTLFAEEYRNYLYLARLNITNTDVQQPLNYFDKALEFANSDDTRIQILREYIHFLRGIKYNSQVRQNYEKLLKLMNQSVLKAQYISEYFEFLLFELGDVTTINTISNEILNQWDKSVSSAIVNDKSLYYYFKVYPIIAAYKQDAVSIQTGKLKENLSFYQTSKEKFVNLQKEFGENAELNYYIALNTYQQAKFNTVKETVDSITLDAQKQFLKVIELDNSGLYAPKAKEYYDLTKK